MPTRNRLYPLEFRSQMVKLVGAGRTPEELPPEHLAARPSKSDERH